MRHCDIMRAATAAARTVDKANFKNIASICALSASEAPSLHLVAVTATGVRLYFTTVGAGNSPDTRPYQLQLLHVRLPPGFSA
ncbi:Nucleoporin Nup133/Nup155-like N-terminal, partial [Trinorchestia longiramus]